MPNTADIYQQQLQAQQQNNSALADQYKSQADAIQNQLSTLPGFDSKKAWQDYQTGGKPMLEAIMSNYQKPVPTLTPEQEQKAKYGSALTDTMSTLAEMFASGQGAMVRNRANDPTSTQTTNARLQALQDKYKNDLMQYNHINSNVQLQDWGQARQDAKYESEKQYNNLFAQLKQARAQEAAARKAAETAQKEGIDYGLKKDAQDETKNYHNKSLSIEQQKANKEKTDKFSGIIINAHPSDPKGQIDETGNKVIQYHLTKPAIQNIAGTAQQDAEFMAQDTDKNSPLYGKIMVDKQSILGVPTKGLTTDEELARMYRKYRYDKGFAPKTEAIQTPYLLPELKNIGKQQGKGKTISNF